MGVHGPAHRSAHLRSSRAPALRVEPDHRCLDHHTTRAEAARGIPLPPSVPTLSGKRGHGFCAPAASIEPACAYSFPSRCRTYATGIAPCLADRDLDLLEERLSARIDARSTIARPPRPDPKIFALIACHGETIDVETSPHKSRRAGVASNRVNAQGSEPTAGTLIRTHCGSRRLKD
jgi:hypothetical protein